MSGPTSERVDRPLRVLQLIARMNVGGPATQVLALAQHLDPARYQVTIATGQVGAGEADYLALRAPDARVEAVPGFGRAVRTGADARAAAAVRSLLRRLRPDVVHTHTAKAGAIGRAVASRQGIPTVHTFHGHLLHGYFRPAVTRAVVAAERRMAGRTDQLIAVGEQVRRELLDARIGTPERFVAIPPGVEAPSAPSRATARAQLDLTDDRPVLVSVGRLTGIKRPDRLLDAVVRVAARLPVAPVLLLAGDGELRDQLEVQAAELALDVRFLGWRGDVGTVLAAADLAVLSSDNEGMPVALIEAALLGLPAVATDVGSVREVVLDRRTGRLVTPSADALADATLELLTDPTTRAAYGAAAREHVTSTFGPQALAEATAAVYDRVVARR